MGERESGWPGLAKGTEIGEDGGGCGLCRNKGEVEKEEKEYSPLQIQTEDIQSFIGRRTKDDGMWFGPGYSLASVFLLPFINTISSYTIPK